MKNLFTTTSIITMLAGAAFAGEGGPCWDQYENELDQCDSMPDPITHVGCTAAAFANYEYCSDDEFNPDFYKDLWDAYLETIKQCAEDNPVDDDDLRECLMDAYNQYEDDLFELYFPDDDDDCRPTLAQIPRVNPISPLVQLAVAAGYPSGRLPVVADTAISFNAGISANPGNPYNVGQVPCVKSSIAIAVYSTPSGPVSIPFDADLTPANGTTFTYFPSAPDLVGTSSVSIVVMFYDENDMPVLAEQNSITIEDSPIPGDWNRDLSKDYLDVSSFIATFNAELPRADLYNDGVFDIVDVNEFLAMYNTP